MGFPVVTLIHYHSFISNCTHNNNLTILKQIIRICFRADGCQFFRILSLQQSERVTTYSQSTSLNVCLSWNRVFPVFLHHSLTSDRRKHWACKSKGPGSPALLLHDSDDALICLPEESKQTRERLSHRGVDTAVAL